MLFLDEWFSISTFVNVVFSFPSFRLVFSFLPCAGMPMFNISCFRAKRSHWIWVLITFNLRTLLHFSWVHLCIVYYRVIYRKCTFKWIVVSIHEVSKTRVQLDAAINLDTQIIIRTSHFEPIISFRSDATISWRSQLKVRIVDHRCRSHIRLKRES